MSSSQNTRNTNINQDVVDQFTTFHSSFSSVEQTNINKPIALIPGAILPKVLINIEGNVFAQASSGS